MVQVFNNDTKLSFLISFWQEKSSVLSSTAQKDEGMANAFVQHSTTAL